MSSYCNFVQQEACILRLTNHGCFSCPCWSLDGGSIFYMRIRSIAAAVVIFPMSCLGLVVGGDKERNGDLGRIETEHGYAKNNS
jgi:hypothetical protein